MEGVRGGGEPRARVRIFPIRHHSPAAALLLEQEIERRPPLRILIEGPSDADALIPILLDERTVPPVAILAWRPAGPSAIYPFCRSSPEYVALRAARRLGISARFIDIPTSFAMDHPEEREIEDDLPFGEDFWETAFESGGLSEQDFARLFLEYAALLRPGHVSPLDRIRESFMAREIAMEPADGTLVVCGAFHAVALLEGVNPEAFEPGTPAELAVIPYSFPRISPGAPRFSERVYTQGPARAALSTILEATHRLEGSLAEAIDAWRLARTLGGMREKATPGIREIREAVTACVAQGEAVDLSEVLVGRECGRVRLSRSPLQDEFYAEVRARGLPIADAPREVTIPRDPFLHRVSVAGIPFAALLAPGVREKWRVQWSPSTDGELLRRIEWGTNLADVARRMIRTRLAAARSTAPAAELFPEARSCGLDDLLPEILNRCSDLASVDADLHSLAAAALHLRPSEIEDRIVARALFHLPQGARVTDARADRVCEAIRMLSGAEGFAPAARRLLDDPAAHPRVAGVALALLPDDPLPRLSLELSPGNPVPRAASFLEGLLSGSRAALVRRRDLVLAVDRYLASIEMPRFLTVLPLFRRAFAGVTPAEARYLLESLDGEPDAESRLVAGGEEPESLAVAIHQAHLARLRRSRPPRGAEQPPESLFGSDWSDATAAPFIVASLRTQPELALKLLEKRPESPIAGRTAVQLAAAIRSEAALKRLSAEPMPIARWAEDALGRKSSARREAHADLIRTALWGRRRAAAVAALGRTRDPIFADVLRIADADGVALALVGDDSRLEEWIAEKRWRPLVILRESRGLAAVREAAAKGDRAAQAALREVWR